MDERRLWLHADRYCDNPQLAIAYGSAWHDVYRKEKSAKAEETLRDTPLQEARLKLTSGL